MKRTLLIIALQLAANGADAYYTYDNMGRPHFHEVDPVASPFTHNTSTLVGGSALSIAGSLLLERKLRHQGKTRWADALAAAQVAGHTYGAITSRDGRVTTTTTVVKVK